MKKVERKAKDDLKAQVRLGSCYQKRSRTQKEAKLDTICKIKSIKSELAEKIIQVSSCNQKEVEMDRHKAIDNYPKSAKKVCKILEWRIKSTEYNNSNGYYNPILCYQNRIGKNSTLVQELVSDKEKPIQEPRDEINIKK
ncbi:13337_t:CDS:2, partial [Gigaspora rosea]